MPKAWPLSLFTLLFLSTHLSSQTVEDFGVWGTVSYGSDLTDDIDFSIDQEFRMEQNNSILGVVFTSLGADYRFNRYFQLGLNYRFILNRQDEGFYGHRHRVMLDLQGRKMLRQWTFAYRMRAQSEVRTRNYANEFGFAPTTDLRNTVKTVYRLNRQFEIYGSIDLRILYRDPRLPEYRGIDRLRYRVGTDILLARDRSLGVFIQHQREVNIPNREIEFNLGLEFKFGSRMQLMQS